MSHKCCMEQEDDHNLKSHIILYYNNRMKLLGA